MESPIDSRLIIFNFTLDAIASPMPAGVPAKRLFASGSCFRSCLHSDQAVALIFVV
ncbi:hypothetical protein H6F78_16470 [Coleofasciculus sp. FACHB-64]|uniref:hypothetical protein n=1 Tax=Cyanophyceae TaxID=3028117 RepID=UPI0016839E0D|nr:MULTISPECIES: hypothetical protein [unclassified Coleofasciculus]MBD1840822.1 hypothetical protein [Coleofasciculus sp. FACHB-501]MBD2047170.1 hypothetical protein [Coleofasciculus sp. FACHB-64]